MSQLKPVRQRVLTAHSTFLLFLQEALFALLAPGPRRMFQKCSLPVFCLSSKLRSKTSLSKKPPKSQTPLGPSFIGSYSIHSACQQPSSMSAVSRLRAPSNSAPQWPCLMLWTLSNGSSQVLGFLFLCKLLLGNITKVDINETHRGPMGSHSLHLAVKTNSLNEVMGGLGVQIFWLCAQRFVLSDHQAPPPVR